MGIFSFFILISIFYVFVGIKTGYEVVRNWASLWDDQVTAEDVRLGAKASFFLLIPLSVLLHELGHAVFVWVYGLDVVDFKFYGYMGYVVPSDSAGALGDFVISLAGNAVTFFLGLSALVVGLYRPGHAFRNILLIELGRQSMFIVLVFYPLICLVFPGDFQRIYDFGQTPIASGLTALVHGLVVTIGYRQVWKRRWQPRAFLLCGQYAKTVVDAEARLGTHPDDLDARRRLGLVHIAVEDMHTAAMHLAPVVAAGKADGQTLLAYGIALLGLRRTEQAIEQLEAAEKKLLLPEQRRMADAAVGRALTELGRTDEALERLSGIERREMDGETLEAWGQAMRDGGRKEELRGECERLLDTSLDAERLRVVRGLYDSAR